MDIQYGNLGQLAWLWLVGACLLVTLGAAIFQRRALRTLRHGQLAPPSRAEAAMICGVTSQRCWSQVR